MRIGADDALPSPEEQCQKRDLWWSLQGMERPLPRITIRRSVRFLGSARRNFSLPPPLHVADEGNVADAAGSPAGVMQLMDTLIQARQRRRSEGGDVWQEGIQADQRVDPETQITRERLALEREYR